MPLLRLHVSTTVMIMGIKFVLAVILTEAVTELIIESEIFEPIKLKIMRIGQFFEKLLTCGYCMSVWTGICASYLFQLTIGLKYLSWFEPLILGFVIHRLSNLYHDFTSIITKVKMPNTPLD